MKVGVLSYPMLFQNEGGLQIQISETLKYLQQEGVDINLVDPIRESLAEYDLVHVFAAIHGNEKLVEQAKAKGCKVVLSPIINPSLIPPTTVSLRAVQILGRAINYLSKWTVTTNYHAVRKALINAHHLIVLSDLERSILKRIYGIDAKNMSVIPNGVSPHFFEADENCFKAQYSIRSPFVFCPALISSWKNQKTLVQALAGTGITVVLAGPVFGQEQNYLEECMNIPGAQARYLGNLERSSSIFAACYSAANAVVLPSKGESGPLVAVESLAAGTPAVITRRHGLDLQPDGVRLITVDPFDSKSIRQTVQRVIESPPAKTDCQDFVAHLSWKEIAKNIAEVYKRVLKH